MPIELAIVTERRWYYLIEMWECAFPAFPLNTNTLAAALTLTRHTYAHSPGVPLKGCHCCCWLCCCYTWCCCCCCCCCRCGSCRCCCYKRWHSSNARGPRADLSSPPGIPPSHPLGVLCLPPPSPLSPLSVGLLRRFHSYSSIKFRCQHIFGCTHTLAFHFPYVLCARVLVKGCSPTNTNSSIKNSRSLSLRRSLTLLFSLSCSAAAAAAARLSLFLLSAPYRYIPWLKFSASVPDEI